MSKKINKNAKATGEGILTIIGIVLGLVLAGVFWAWYESSFSDSTQVMTTAFILIILIFVIWYLILMFTKKSYADVYRKALFMGLGFFIGILIIGFVLGYLGLSASLSVGTLVYGVNAWSRPKLAFDPRLLRQQMWIQ